MMDFNELTRYLYVDVTTMLVFVFTLLLVYVTTRRRPGIPPGPPRWPVIGNIGSLASRDVLKRLDGLRQTYGDVYSIYVGQQLVVVDSGYDAIHDALVKNGRAFAWRLLNNIQKELKEDTRALIYGNGREWKEKRTFVMNALNEFCYGKSSPVMERLILNEINAFTDELDKSNEPVFLRTKLSVSLANVIFSIIYGSRPGYNDPKFNKLLKTTDDIFQSFAKHQLTIYLFPWLEYGPVDFVGKKLASNVMDDLMHYLDTLWIERSAGYTEGDRNCLLDFMMSKDSPIDRDCLSKPMFDLIVAGSETTALTLNWLILYLILNPKIQDTLYKHIREVVGTRDPSINDRKHLPYVEATILETLRISTLGPVSLPHTVVDDTLLRGFLIPKDTLVLPNIASVHLSEHEFQKPSEFQPERFLNEDQTQLVTSEKLIPFSLGPRSCLGETLARVELFLYTVKLVQRYTFELTSGEDKPSVKGVLGLTHRPRDYRLVVKRRQDVAD